MGVAVIAKFEEKDGRVCLDLTAQTYEEYLLLKQMLRDGKYLVRLEERDGWAIALETGPGEVVAKREAA